MIRYSVDLPDNSDLRSKSHSITDKTLVLDMDSTLIYTLGDGDTLSHRLRTRHKNAYQFLVDKGIIVPTSLVKFGGSGMAEHCDIVRRPGLKIFLNFCRYLFKNLILWSAGNPTYVRDTVRNVIEGEDKIFDKIYTADNTISTTIESAKDTDDEEKLVYAEGLQRQGIKKFTIKPLDVVFQDFPDADPTNTVIVDDLRTNFQPNPRNGVWVPPFSPDLVQLAEGPNMGPLDNICNDHKLLSLIHFFSDQEFIDCPDVRTYDLKFFR